MKLGITPWQPQERSALGLTAQAKRAEQLGYDAFWLPENHFNPDAIPDPLMLLAAVAGSTSRIRLATTSYLLPLRHPLQAAEQVAVLDQLSGGRVILGVGRGYAAQTFKAFAVSARHKRSLFETSLATMVRAWSGAPVSIGDTVDECVVLDPLPVQQPHPPLWVAAFGPKALAQAGRLGLPYLASPVEPLEVLEHNYARHREAVAEAGETPPQEVPVMRSLFVTDNARETRAVRDALQEAAAATGRLPAGAGVEDWSIVGESGYVGERVNEYRERLGMTHLVVARLRLGGLDPHRVEASVARTVEILGTAEAQP